MADLTKSAVAVTHTIYVGVKRDRIEREVTLTLTTQGTAANAITAASCGYHKFKGISYLTKSDDSVVLIGIPSADGSKLLLKAAGTNDPADYSGTFSGTISGV